MEGIYNVLYHRISNRYIFTGAGHQNRKRWSQTLFTDMSYRLSMCLDLIPEDELVSL